MFIKSFATLSLVISMFCTRDYFFIPFEFLHLLDHIKDVIYDNNALLD